MRIGLINEIHGDHGSNLTFESILARARVAEDVGFDSFVVEDALLYRGGDKTDGVWESMTVVAALLSLTDRIQIGQSVINSPYRSPAMTASIVSSLDEISGGRYLFGIGAGNTADSDYEAFGFPTDHRYSRFAEAIEIIHTLLKTGACDFSGEYYTVKESELVLRGPNPTGPSINIAAGGPKMIELVALFGDAWNWWSYDENLHDFAVRIASLQGQLDDACKAVGRQPDTVFRTLDLYSVLAPGHEPNPDRPGMVTGPAEGIAEHLCSVGDHGFSEIRCDVWPKKTTAIEAMAPVLDAVRARQH